MVHIIDFTANDNFIVGAVSVDVLQTILRRSSFNVIQQFIKTLGRNVIITQIVDDRAVVGNNADVFEVGTLKRNCDDHFTNTAYNITRKGVPIIDRCDTMYNSVINDWKDVEHQIPFDVRQPKTHAYTMRRLREYLESHPYVNVVRFTTFFHLFTLVFDELRREKYVDWYGYRDARTNGKLEQAAACMPAEELYAHTGNQIMAINTLFQLLALQEQEPELLQKAAQILFMPDLFAALLGAEPVCERSIASTSQMLDPRTGQWSREVLAVYGLNEKHFAPLVASGTVTGTLTTGAKIIAVAGHDTQCASAAMPCAEEDSEHTAFLSCGTWSLLGTELDAPILTADSCQSGLSNELGANGKINYLKNIIGLWLIQESRREYKRRGQAYSFAELEQQALAAEPLRSFIDPDAPEFVAPGDLPGRIQEFCRRTGQPIPETVGAVMRCIYESLALKYRYAIEQLSAVTGRTFTTLHVLGGGTKDRLLCQMTADCCGLTVKAGPVEATALGNIMIQLKALGLLDSITQGRRLIAETEVIKTYTPSTQNYAEWNAAYDRFKTLL